tara:strand:+ start:246 stop:1847 length:1602 start_codon:yes stop_codon:yes gene_type:complete
VKNLQRTLIIGCSALALAGCGADEIVSPGTGGNVTINNPAPPPPPPPPPPTTALITPAPNCPTIAGGTIQDLATISGPTGEYRRCRLPTDITASSTLPNVAGLVYELNGQTNVGVDQGFSSTNTEVVLEIEPGVIVIADGSDFLNINRGNQLEAVGTQTSPIIFTSRQNLQGQVNIDSSSQWGGVILSGRAPVAQGCARGGPNGNDCQRAVEGAPNEILYGGSNSADNSGTISYVQIRFSGVALAPDAELQSLTTGGVGSGTTINNVMSFNSSDDGAEFFGGTVNVRRFIAVGAEDDSLDTDNGVKGTFDEVLVVQRSTIADTVIEQDSSAGASAKNDTPRTNVRINNATLISNSTGGDGLIRLRSGASDFGLYNSLLVDLRTNAPADWGCLKVDDNETINQAANPAIDEAGPFEFQSVAFDCPTNFFDTSRRAATEAQVDAGAGNDKAYTNTLQRLTGVTTGAAFINGANENSYLPIFDVSAVSAFYANSTRGYIGAVPSEAANWAEGWTCNSAVVTLGLNNTGSCLSMPTS